MTQCGGLGVGAGRYLGVCELDLFRKIILDIEPRYRQGFPVGDRYGQPGLLAQKYPGLLDYPLVLHLFQRQPVPQPRYPRDQQSHGAQSDDQSLPGNDADYDEQHEH